MARSARGNIISVCPVVVNIRRFNNAKRFIASVVPLDMFVHMMEQLGNATEYRRYEEVIALLAAA